MLDHEAVDSGMNNAGTGESSSDSGASPPGRTPPLDPAVFELLLARIEFLSRELGRAEGKQFALDRQIARLEQQLARLERERERDAD